MTHKLFKLGLVLALLAVALGIASGAQADGPVTTDDIAGVWNGNMHFSNRNSVERIKFTIPAGCEAGEVCGMMQNFPVQCTWEITYDGFRSGAYQYHFSNTLDGTCPAGSAGYLVLQPDGSLNRTHNGPGFISSGRLVQLPSALK